MEQGVQYGIFAVGDEPHCLWAWDLAARNLEFIEGIDEGYFEYFAGTYQNDLDGDNAQRAAMALRTSYHLSLETMFSLMAAALQAPECAVGWVLKVRSEQLRSIVEALQKDGMDFPIKWRMRRPLGFAEVAHLVLQYAPWAAQMDDGTVGRFAILWARLASDFLDKAAIAEYNCIKHGFRARAGGFFLRTGREHELGTPPPEPEMSGWMGSTFGSSFHVAEPIGSRSGRDPHFTLRRQSLNWLPDNTAGRMLLAAVSIKNLRSFLAVENNRTPQATEFRRPADPADFDRPWERSPGITAFNIDRVAAERHIEPVSRDELRRLLESGAAPSEGG
jgi:hypothetical protein